MFSAYAIRTEQENKDTEAGKLLSKFGASQGGKARAEQLSSARLSRIAKHAANKRWGNKSVYK